MTVEETAEILTIIKAGLPNAYLKLTEADARAMVMLWAEMFANSPKDLVMAAAKTYVWNDKTGRFPTPGALRDEMEKIERVINQCAYGSTLWEYMGTSANKFPPVVQQYMEREYRQKHLEIYGREFTGQIEKQMAYMRQLEAGTTD